VLIAGVILAAAGLLLLSRLPVHAGYAGHVLPAFLMIGIGMGMSFLPLQIAAATGVTGPQAGLAAGLINTSQEAGGALGVAIVSTIAFTRIDHLMSAAGSNPAAQIAARASGYHHAFFAGACFAGASLVLAAALLPWMKAPDGTEPASPPAAA